MYKNQAQLRITQILTRLMLSNKKGQLFVTHFGIPWRIAYLDHILVGIQPFYDFRSSPSYNYPKFISDVFLCSILALIWYFIQSKLLTHRTVSTREELIRKTHSSYSLTKNNKNQFSKIQLNMPIVLAGDMMSADKCTEKPKSLNVGSSVIRCL